MSVPEASVHEDGFPAGAKCDVRLAWQSLDVHRVPIAQASKSAPNGQLRTSVGAPNCGHERGTLRFSQAIHRSALRLARSAASRHTICSAPGHNKALNMAVRKPK